MWTDDMSRECKRLLAKEEKGSLTPAQRERLAVLLHTYDESWYYVADTMTGDDSGDTVSLTSKHF